MGGDARQGLSPTLGAMDSGEAALWGALIGAGSSLVVSLAIPLVSATIGERVRAERRRRELIRETFPRVVTSVVSTNSTDLLELIAQFQVLLKPDEWAIGEIPLRVAATPPRSALMAKAAGAMIEVVSAWIRKEISAEEARAYFVGKTGIEVERTDFRNPEANVGSVIPPRP